MDRTPSRRRASRRAAVAYAGAGTKPPVAELLNDPITQTLIASDRVRPEDIGALLEAARRRAAYATATAAYQGFRTASRTLCDAPHRHSARSRPKTLVSRLYGS